VSSASQTSDWVGVLQSFRNAFIPRNYAKPNYGGGAGLNCTLKTGQFNGSRQSVLLTFTQGKAPNSASVSLQLANGDIVGHPFQENLLKAQIDKVAAYNDFTWGIETEASNRGGGMNCFFGVYANGHIGAIMNARQFGNNIDILFDSEGNTPICGASLVLVP
jgi:hypothetical protein